MANKVYVSVASHKRYHHIDSAYLWLVGGGGMGGINPANMGGGIRIILLYSSKKMSRITK
ncbi:MAG: hypothetical protein COY04_01150 [Parcubacteria group bacterium CG_4_10_14_0_2_um_filter_7_35_8]|nr:MAG: hypothetical protein COX42_00685 [Parcubacteria group bacterium CG23_combo_of_CG06-09_8_20_14_all_35_6]PIZ76814.1 MAG: hypothetical protein COY04_01150 [Parcubacteria group bacterium CG_4_10_14_0_2_um_filter_7_35_8]